MPFHDKPSPSLSCVQARCTCTEHGILPSVAQLTCDEEDCPVKRLGVELYACSYGDCKKQFRRKLTLSIHINSVHKPLACPHCETQLPDAARRREHLAREHPGMPVHNRQLRKQGQSAPQ
ncbi:hypothetical protein B0H34DRAFT_706987 [Crassisporium funariophilum]|nr:hypothetical protein B0H34DRAFT_706987 [Crassisporium funariophilum]